MRRLLAVLLSVAPTAAHASTAPETGVAYTLVRTSVFALRSADEHEYRVMVSWPEGTPPASGWPVLYVLDGEDNFALAAQTLRRLARAGARSGVEDRVIVAIESGGLARRVFDYTPATPGWTIPAGFPAAGLPTGGADAFLDFMSGIVVPEIARRWPIDADRQALIGHSFGGLVGVHAYLTKPRMFASVVAVSPSLWFGGDVVSREVAARRSSGGRLLIAAGTEERGPGGQATAAANDLAARLGARSLALPGQSHGSTMLAAMVPALIFLSERKPE